MAGATIDGFPDTACSFTANLCKIPTARPADESTISSSPARLDRDYRASFQPVLSRGLAHLQPVKGFSFHSIIEQSLATRVLWASCRHGIRAGQRRAMGHGPAGNAAVSAKRQRAGSAAKTKDSSATPSTKCSNPPPAPASRKFAPSPPPATAPQAAADGSRHPRTWIDQSPNVHRWRLKLEN